MTEREGKEVRGPGKTRGEKEVKQIRGQVLMVEEVRKDEKRKTSRGGEEKEEEEEELEEEQQREAKQQDGRN